jgi:hypothetical protein
MADEKYEIHTAAREGRRELPLVVSSSPWRWTQLDSTLNMTNN